MRGVVAEKMAPYTKFLHKLERQMQLVKDMEESRDALIIMKGDELVRCEIWIDEATGINCSCPLPVGLLRTAIINGLQREQRILREMLALVQDIPTQEEKKS